MANSYYSASGKTVTNTVTSDQTDVNDINTAVETACDAIEADINTNAAAILARSTSTLFASTGNVTPAEGSYTELIAEASFGAAVIGDTFLVTAGYIGSGRSEKEQILAKLLAGASNAATFTFSNGATSITHMVEGGPIDAQYSDVVNDLFSVMIKITGAGALYIKMQARSDTEAAGTRSTISTGDAFMSVCKL